MSRDFFTSDAKLRACKLHFSLNFYTIPKDVMLNYNLEIELDVKIVVVFT